MSTSSLEVPADQSTLMIVAWDDPVVDAVGFEVRSTYVELFWLNVLGPTATWLLRLMVRGLDRYPLGYELDLAETAGMLGLSYTPGTSNPFMRSLNRCVLFGVAQGYAGGLAVRRRIPPVAMRHLARMPEVLREAHADWVRRPGAPSGAVDDADERGRVLAAALAAVGDEGDAVERQLLALGVAPRTAARLAEAAAGTSAHAASAGVSGR